jgi:oligo-alginate lyase
LRAPSGDLTEVMKFGPHGGGHGHYDKLGEVIYGDGGLLSVDPGTQFYAVASHDTWDRETVAHNTIVVDEQSQKKATGKLLSWQVAQQFTAVNADAGPAYAGTSLQRRVILTSKYILEITSAVSTDGLDHTFDWVYHNFGTQELKLPVQPWSGFSLHDGYQHLSQNRAADTTADWQDIFRVPAAGELSSRGMHLWVLGTGGATKVLSGFGLGPDLTVPVPYVMARRKGRSTVFVALMEPFAVSPSIEQFQRMSNDVYLVEGPDWRDTIIVGAKVEIRHQRLASTHPNPKMISEAQQ